MSTVQIAFIFFSLSRGSMFYLFIIYYFYLFSFTYLELYICTCVFLRKGIPLRGHQEQAY